METTKNIATEYIQKEMKKKFKYFPIKNKLNAREDIMHVKEGNEGQNTKEENMYIKEGNKRQKIL